MAESPPIEITVGEAVEDADILAFTVDRDMFQPDMAAIVVSNPAGPYSKTEIGAPVEIKIGDDKTSIYKGEVVGIEADYKGGEKTKIIFRAMNQFHRLLRHRKSVTFQDKTDQQILNQVAGASGLSVQWKHEKSIPYKHVYQHNQTDMEFLRMRAARMGCHVWCVGGDLYVQQPDLNSSPIATLKVGSERESADEGAIKWFRPRVSSASIVKKVTVKGWNPEKKELITGTASASNSNLGSQNAASAASKLVKEEETFTVDHPIWSKEEADALAKARLTELSLTYVTGECELAGDPKYDLGKIIEIQANEEPDTASDDPFNGKYYIMGITHRLILSKTKEGGYTTILRLARDAWKK
jgi:phage protein D